MLPLSLKVGVSNGSINVIRVNRDLHKHTINILRSPMALQKSPETPTSQHVWSCSSHLKCAIAFMHASQSTYSSQYIVGS